MKDIEWLLKIPIAHRGLHDTNCPENSLGAFKKAIEKGCAIELDVQVLVDGTVVVFHDENLKRMTSVSGIMQNIKYDDIKPLFLNKTQCKIPTLKEVLNLVKGQVPLLIEIKKNVKKKQIKNILEEMEKYRGQYAIQSFDPFILRRVRRWNKSVLRGQLSSGFKGEKMSRFRKNVLTKMKLNWVSKPNFISYNVEDLPNRYVTKTGLPVIGWTVKSGRQYDKIKSFCDNIIFENFMPQ